MHCFTMVFYLVTSFGPECGPSGHYTRTQKCIQKPYLPIRLETSPFYNNSALKMYMKSIRVLSNYKRPKDI
jgi:hypothetical protein